MCHITPRESEAIASNLKSEVKYNNAKIFAQGDNLNKVFSMAPAFDARKVLIDKARTVIRNKLEELRSSSAAAGEAPSEGTTLVGLNR